MPCNTVALNDGPRIRCQDMTRCPCRCRLVDFRVSRQLSIWAYPPAHLTGSLRTARCLRPSASEGASCGIVDSSTRLSKICRMTQTPIHGTGRQNERRQIGHITDPVRYRGCRPTRQRATLLSSQRSTESAPSWSRWHSRVCRSLRKGARRRFTSIRRIAQAESKTWFVPVGMRTVFRVRRFQAAQSSDAANPPHQAK